MTASITPFTPATLRPLTLGRFTIESPLALAPMAGYTDYAYRHLVRLLGGCGLLYTELISSQAIHYGNRKTFELFTWSEDEQPVSVQLYGSDPAVIADAARSVVDRGATIVDINMGCWVPKLAGRGSGAALLRDVETAARVVEAVVQAVAVPVTVQVRSGWDPGHPTAIEFARAAEAAGVRLIAVHARYARQAFAGQADWSIIRQVKEAVGIPVLGNGDVITAADAARMLAETGCDGVMIGRAARGAPWLFRQIEHELRTGEPLPLPDPAERAAIALHHTRLAVQTLALPEPIAILELRKHYTRYRLDVPGAAEIRRQLVQAEALADVERILLPLAAGVDPARSAWVTWEVESGEQAAGSGR